MATPYTTCGSCQAPIYKTAGVPGACTCPDGLYWGLLANKATPAPATTRVASTVQPSLQYDNFRDAIHLASAPVEMDIEFDMGGDIDVGPRPTGGGVGGDRYRIDRPPVREPYQPTRVPEDIEVVAGIREARERANAPIPRPTMAEIRQQAQARSMREALPERGGGQGTVVRPVKVAPVTPVYRGPQPTAYEMIAKGGGKRDPFS